MSEACKIRSIINLMEAIDEKQKRDPGGHMLGPNDPYVPYKGGDVIGLTAEQKAKAVDAGANPAFFKDETLPKGFEKWYPRQKEQFINTTLQSQVKDAFQRPHHVKDNDFDSSELWPLDSCVYHVTNMDRLESIRAKGLQSNSKQAHDKDFSGDEWQLLYGEHPIYVHMPSKDVAALLDDATFNNSERVLLQIKTEGLKLLPAVPNIATRSMEKYDDDGWYEDNIGKISKKEDYVITTYHNRKEVTWTYNDIFVKRPAWFIKYTGCAAITGGIPPQNINLNLVAHYKKKDWTQADWDKLFKSLGL